MQHCTTPIFVGDKYCPDCAQALTDLPQLKQIDELTPEVFDELKQHFPNTWVVTGRILSTFFYKRHYSSSKANLTYGFWWIELEDKGGEVYRFSVDAEARAYENLKKGDVLSAVFPTTIYSTHDIVGDEADDRVTNDKRVPAGIVHGDAGQKYFIEGVYQPVKKSESPWIFVIAVAAFVSLFVLLGPGPVALFGGAAITLIAFIIDFSLKHKAFKKEEKKYTALTHAMDKLLSVSKAQLGFDLVTREPQNSDVFCVQCDTRIARLSAHCPACGASQKQVNDTASSLSVQAQEDALLSKYRLDYSDQYEHKNVLASNNKGDVNVSCILAKVISRDTKTNFSDVTNVTTTTTHYHVYRGGRYVGSEQDTKVDRFRSRQSGMSGSLLIQLADNELRDQSFAEDMIGDLDVGDWFLYARADSDIKPLSHNRQYAFNVTKNKSYNSTSFQDYSGSSSFGLWFCLLCLFGGLNWWLIDKWPHLLGLIPDQKIAQLLSQYSLALDYSPLWLFAVITVFWLLRSIKLNRQNKIARRTLLSPLNELLQRFEAELPELQENLRKLS